MKKIICLLTSFFVLVGCSTKPEVIPFVLLEDIIEGVTVELGDVLSLDYNEYVQFELEDDSLFVLELDYELEEDELYLPVGEYVLTISYEDTIHNVSVKVEDTVAPVFSQCDDLEIDQNDEINFD